jgi:hypothetical protein
MTMPTISETILSPVIIQDAKNAIRDGIVIIAPIIDPFRNMPFVGLDFLSMNGFFCAIIKIKKRILEKLLDVGILSLVALYLAKRN